MWKLALTKGAGATDAAQNAAQSNTASSVEAIEAHPALQSLQKIFPGSKVEQVRVKN
jgi:hypothetical protein